MIDKSMNSENRDHDLNRLFASYHEACGSPEPGPNFMPMLWQKIEARQSKNVFFERLARTFVAGTLAACGLLGLVLVLPGQQQSAFENGSYVEVIAEADAGDAVPFVEPVRYNLHRDAATSYNPQ